MYNRAFEILVVMSQSSPVFLLIHQLVLNMCTKNLTSPSLCFVTLLLCMTLARFLFHHRTQFQLTLH